MKLIYILFCFILTLIPLKLEAGVEKIGATDVDIFFTKYDDLNKVSELTLHLINISNTEQMVYYELTGFKTKENKTIPTKLCLDNDTLEYKRLPVIIKEISTFNKNEKKDICLKFKFEEESDEYSGKLTIHSFPVNGGSSSSKETVNFTFRKYVEQPPKLKLEVNKGSKERIYKVIELCSKENEGDTNAIKLNLTNKSEKDPIENVTIQLSSFVKDKKTSMSFDAEKYKKDVGPIKSNKSEVISLPLPKIDEPGTYDIEFNIEAEGVETQRITAVVHARYPIWFAIIVILIGAFLSYLVTQGIIIYRTKYQRSVLIKKIRREVEDFSDDNAYLKERIRALASISRKLNKNWIRISKKKTKDFLDLAEYLLKVGKQKGEIWYKLQDVAAPQELVKKASHDLKEVDRLVAKYDVLEPQTMTEINSLLENAKKYTEKAEGNKYWLELKQKIEELLEKVDVQKIKVEGAKPYIEKLKSMLEKNKEKTEIEYDKLKPIDQAYKKLDLIWAYKDDNKLNKDLIETISENGDEGLNRALYTLQWKDENKKNWDKIIKNLEQGKVKINPPSYVIEAEVGVFTVDFSEEELNKSYLVRRGLTYDWEFTTFTEKNNSPDKTRVPPSTGMKTNSIAKYFPKPGCLDISLKIHYKAEDDSITIDEKGIQVETNEDIKWIKQISWVELGLSVVALIFAVIFGLESQYFNKPAFGSTGDLVTLFKWAVLLDQGKNFIYWIKKIKDSQKQSEQI